MIGPRKQDYMSIIGKLHEEHFGSEEDQRVAKKLAEERATANAELAYRFANLAMPEDIRSRSTAWGMEAFCETLWNNAFQAGFREATRTPDPAQIRADAIRDALEPINFWLERFGHVQIKHVSAQKYATDAILDIQDAILALLDSPLSPTAVDGSPAPDAGGKEGL